MSPTSSSVQDDNQQMCNNILATTARDEQRSRLVTDPFVPRTFLIWTLRVTQNHVLHNATLRAANTDDASLCLPSLECHLHIQMLMSITCQPHDPYFTRRRSGGQFNRHGMIQWLQPRAQATAGSYTNADKHRLNCTRARHRRASVEVIDQTFLEHSTVHTHTLTFEAKLRGIRLSTTVTDVPDSRTPIVRGDVCHRAVKAAPPC